MAEVFAVYAVDGSVAGETTELGDFGYGVFSAAEQFVGQCILSRVFIFTRKYD